MKNGFCADEFKEYMDLKKQDRNSEEEARYKELDNKYAGIEVFKGSKSPKEQFEQMNEESKVSLEDYSARVKKLVDKTTFDDQDFYDHMIDCFIEGKTPEVCAKFKNESESTWTKLKAITEANRIQVKRKYTEIHPAKYVGERARVRNEIIKYLGSNQLMTEDEFEDLLSKNAKHPLLWKKRNRDIYEQGEDGYIRLSKKGSRIFGGLNSVNEAEYIDALNAIETDGFVDAFIVNKIDVKDTDFQYLRKKYVKTYEAITKYLKSKYPTEFMEIEEDFDAVITDFKNFEEFKSLMNDKEFQKLRASYLEVRDNLYDYTESKVNESNLDVDLIDVWIIKDKSKLSSVLKYLQANNVEFEYNPKNSSVEIIDVSNLTLKGLEELQKMLK